MIDHARPSNEREDRWGDVLVNVLDSLDRGEQPDVNLWQARYPEFAPELARFFQGEVRLDCYTAPFRFTSETLNGNCRAMALGDFRIIREVGRGGMGVVYEAEQISLNRRVALKVLPFAATMDARQLRRFHNEARAAASLEHPHIVPVYGVGSDRGVHYYAMKFIDGVTLAQVIASQSSQRPGEVTAAPDGDTKPIAALTTLPPHKDRSYYRRCAELIADVADAVEHAHSTGVVHRDIKPGNLMVDSSGTLWVTDFGLAKLGAEPGLTMTGDVLGTLRYMAPEQALAKHDLVDHRADVYALGATLFELLTGQPAVGGEDKEEVLRRIAFDEPARPRSIIADLPKDLETVCQKCLSKEPHCRYQSAGELAADLRRWLEDRPIKARPPATSQRLARVLRRHRYLAWSAVIITASGTAGLAVTTYVIWTKNAEVRNSLEGEARARGRAEANLLTACDAVDQMLTRLGGRHLNDVPQMEAVRAAILQDALTLQRRLQEAQSDDPAARIGLARAHIAVGKINAALGKFEPAAAAHREAVRVYDGLVAETPADPWHRHRLAEARLDLGNSLLGLNRKAEASAVFGAAVADQERLVEAHPSVADFRICLADAYRAAGDLRRAAELRQRLAGEFPTDPAHRHELAAIDCHRAAAFYGMGRPAEAEPIYRRGVSTFETLIAEFPDVADYRRDLGAALHDLGLALKDRGQLTSAAEALNSAVPHLERLARDFPHTPRYRELLARIHANCSEMYALQGKYVEAEGACRQCLKVAMPLSVEFPGHPTARRTLVNTQIQLSEILAIFDRMREAEAAAQQAVAVASELASAWPEPEHRFLLAHARESLGTVYARKGQNADAERAFRDAVAEMEKLTREFPANAGFRSRLGPTYCILATVLAGAGRWSEAASAYREAVLQCERSVSQFPGAPDVRDALGVAQNNYALLLVVATDSAVRDPAAAVELAKKAIANRMDSASAHYTLGVAQYRAGNWTEALAALQQAADQRYRADGYLRLYIALAHARLGQPDRAREAYARAAKWVTKNGDDDELRALRAEADELLGPSPASPKDN